MSRLSAEEQRLIEAALAEGRVTRCRTGASAFAVEYLWCDRARTLVPVDGKGLGWRGGASFRAHMTARDRRVWDRRGKVKALMLAGRSGRDIATALGVPIHTIYSDAAQLGLRFGDLAAGVS